MVEVFREVRRVLRSDGTLWLNYGDCYAAWGTADAKPAPGQAGNPAKSVTRAKAGATRYGLKHKDLLLMGARVALGLQADGWYLRSEIVWHKPNPLPESVKDRPTCCHEKIFMLSKSSRYFFDQEAVREASTERPSGNTTRKHGASVARPDAKPGDLGRIFPYQPDGSGRNIRNVWSIATAPFPGAHFATFPPEIPLRCIRAGTSLRGVCPECGKPWTRITETVGFNQTGGSKGEKRGNRNPHAGSEMPPGTPVRKTKGWASGCECDAGEPIPATVCDVFMGAGTTGLVAVKEGRRFVGIELNAEYAELARKRITEECSLLLAMGGDHV